MPEMVENWVLGCKQAIFGAPRLYLINDDESIRDHALGGTTTRARLTLLDAWPDVDETSHGLSSPLGKVLAARSSVPQPFL